MPNWCNNGLTLTHSDPAMIERAKSALARGEFFQEFVPCPQELLDPKTSSFGGEDADEKDALRQQLREKYGYESWYDWNIAHWGTKWDTDSQSVEVVNGVLSASFETAWAPPVNFYERLMELGFEITAYYYEPGMAFVGKWADGYDDYFEYSGETSATVRDLIGEELDDYFCISEEMAQYEEEENQEIDLDGGLSATNE